MNTSVSIVVIALVAMAATVDARVVKKDHQRVHRAHLPDPQFGVEESNFDQVGFEPIETNGKEQNNKEMTNDKLLKVKLSANYGEVKLCKATFQMLKDFLQVKLSTNYGEVNRCRAIFKLLGDLFTSGKILEESKGPMTTSLPSPVSTTPSPTTSPPTPQRTSRKFPTPISTSRIYTTPQRTSRTYPPSPTTAYPASFLNLTTYPDYYYY